MLKLFMVGVLTVCIIIEFECTKNTLMIWTQSTKVPWLLWLVLEAHDPEDVNGHLPS
jgi:hypothetical protein